MARAAGLGFVLTDQGDANMNQALTTALVIVLSVALLAAGTDDYNEEVAQAEQYDIDVCAGVMPDYDNRGVDCDE